MKLLITGIDGFLGSTIGLYAQSIGIEVVGVALYRPEGFTGHWESFCHRGDIGDVHFMRPLIEQADAVINCAALVSVPYGEVMPGAYWRTNASAVHTMLLCKPRRFIQVSTSEVFNGYNPPYAPNADLDPITTYGASKAAAEMLCRAHDSATICRIFNLFGPRQYPRAVHPLFIREALRVKNGVKPRAQLDGPHGSRAFMYAPWVALQVVTRVLTDHRKLVQLASPHAIDIGDLWNMIADEVGVDRDCVDWNPDAGRREVAKLYGFSTSGYESPPYSEDGLRKTVSWYAEHFEALPFSELAYQ